MATNLRSVSSLKGRFAGHTSETGASAHQHPVSVYENTLSLSGHRFSYRFYTNPTFTGEPFFFVSGAFQNMRSWDPFVNYVIERGVPAIVADLPGTGDAEPLSEKFGLEFFSEALRLILEHIKCPMVSIVSVSYGTPIGYYFSQLYPALVKRLVLAGTMKEIPPHMRQPVLDNLKELKSGRMKDFAQGAIDGLLTLDPDIYVYRRNLATRLLHSQLIGMSEADKKKYLFNTLRLLSKSPLDLTNPPRCPTLVFTGEHDTFTRPDDCLEIANSIPCSFFTTIKDADHLFHLEQPATTCELCFRFIRDCEIDSISGINDYMPVGLFNSAQSFLTAEAA